MVEPIQNREIHSENSSKTLENVIRIRSTPIKNPPCFPSSFFFSHMPHTALSTSHPHDLMACAQTGSGKTASFLVPLITAISSSTPLPPPLTGLTPVRPRGIVVAPTRELVSQIWGEGRKLCFGGGVKVGCVYGGSPAREQLKVRRSNVLSEGK